MTTAILLTALLTNRSDSFEFTWTPRKGEAVVWSVSIKGKSDGHAVQADSVVTHEVVKVDAEGVVVRSTVKGAMARAGADEGRLQRPEPTVFTMDSRGTVVRVEGLQKVAAWRLAPFNHFVWPAVAVAPGSTWTANLVGDRVAGRADYKLDSVADGVVKVTFAAASLAGDKVTKGQGFWLFDAKTGHATALHAEIEGLMDGVATYDMTLVK